MRTCWQHVSLERPSANELVTLLERPSLLCERHRYPRDEQSSFEVVEYVSAWPSPQQPHTASVSASEPLPSWPTERIVVGQVRHSIWSIFYAFFSHRVSLSSL